jgi:hypothetical protein
MSSLGVAANGAWSFKRRDESVCREQPAARVLAASAHLRAYGFIAGEATVTRVLGEAGSLRNSS